METGVYKVFRLQVLTYILKIKNKTLIGDIFVNNPYKNNSNKLTKNSPKYTLSKIRNEFNL